MSAASLSSLTADEIRVLDNPRWYALTGPHAGFAQANGTALRYDPDVSVFVGLPDERTAQTWLDLAGLMGPGVRVPISGAASEIPAEWQLLSTSTGVQMIDVAVDAVPDDEAIALGAAEAAEMADLVARTAPGPWRPRTYELGTYLGLRHGGRLVAMAGERLHPTGWTEISAVCTDPEFRGRGLAGRLVRAVAHGIRRRGERVLLHARATNYPAIRLYEQLGFEIRRETTFNAYQSPGAVS